MGKIGSPGEARAEGSPQGQCGEAFACQPGESGLHPLDGEEPRKAFSRKGTIKDMPWLFLTLSPPHPIFKSCFLYGALPKCPKSPHLGGLPLAR